MEGDTSAIQATNLGNPSGIVNQDQSTISVTGDVGYDLRAMRELSVEDGEDSTITEDTPEQEPSDNLPEETEQSFENEDTDESFEDPENEAKEVEKIQFKDGENEVGVSKDAKVEITVDGKKEVLTLQEALNRASGATNISRETSRLGRERKRFEQEREAYNAEVKKVSENAEYILQNANDPHSFVEALAELKGEDPETLLHQLVEGTVNYIKEYNEMTPRERELAKRVREADRKQKRIDAQEAIAKRDSEKTQKVQSLTKELEKSGFQYQDFENALEELTERIQNEEELGFGLDEVDQLAEPDVIRWMTERDISNRLEEAVKVVNPKLSEDKEILERARTAIGKTEALYGKMSIQEVQQLLKAFVEQEKKVLSENLSKKAQSRSNSESVNSQDQEDDEFDAISPDEYFARKRF